VPISTGTLKQAFATIKPSSSTWHRCLGDPSSFVVNKILKKHNISFSLEISTYVCDPCQLGKSRQLPYPVSTSVSTVLLEQVFSDVWGPTPLSVGKHPHYGSFIDDFSKFTWIYLLKKRFEVCKVFLNFQQLVDQKFDRKIMTMQSVSGGEYEKLNSLFCKVGISHHVSCPHAHQQNGSVERKHSHIVEVGLSILANASMPLKFWDEAFLTTTFLVNLLPRKVIDFETPIERLLQTTPNYEPIRIFWCACWPNLRPYNKGKLAYRSTQCVFLGYSPLHKGVKCLNVKTGRVYISRYVVFDEKFFPFASLHPNTGIRLSQDILLLPPNLSPTPSQLGDAHVDDSMALPIIPVVTSDHVDAEKNVTYKNTAKTHLESAGNNNSTSTKTNKTALIPKPILSHIMCLLIQWWILQQNLHQSMHQALVVLLLRAPSRHAMSPPGRGRSLSRRRSLLRSPPRTSALGDSHRTTSPGERERSALPSRSPSTLPLWMTLALPPCQVGGPLQL
jgi:histone deacetylase 1/2